MAITTTTVTGPLLDASGDAIANEYIIFRLLTAGADNDVTPTTVIGRARKEVQTDANGDFSKVLWVNGDSDILSLYEITTKTGKINPTKVLIPSSAAGTSIALGELLISHEAGGSDTQQSTVLADAKAYTDALAANPSSNPSFVTGVAEWRSDLSLEVGVDVQAWDSKLDDIAALTPTDGNFQVGNGTTWVAESGDTAQVSLGVQNSSGGANIGSGASATTGGAIGFVANATTGGAIGSLANATTGFAGGFSASAAGTDRVQLGTGTNGTDSTIQFLSSGSVTAAEFGRLIGTSGALYYVGGTDVAVADGGTGASDAATARTNLGIDTAISDANAAGNQGKQVIRSVTFPTTSDYLTVADDASLDVGTGDFSLFFTCRIDSGSSTESIIYKYGGGVGYQVQFVSGALQLIMNDGVEDTFTLATGMDDDKWHVYVITVDRDGNATAYIDNVAQTPVDVTSAALTLDNAGQVQIGVNGGSNPLANGAIASYVGLTKDLMTTAEIEDASFDTTRLKDLSDLSLCVDMSELQIDIFSDRSSNNHAITVNGSLTYNDDRGDLAVANSTIIVRSAADLSGTLSSNKVYLIDGVIDMGTQAITVPSTGLSLRGYGLNVSRLVSTENSYTMFVDAASDAGDLFLSQLTIDVSGTSSQVFDLDNSGAGNAVEMTMINFENCTSIGTLDAYRQFLMDNAFWLNCSDGLTFAGTWSGGARISTFLVRSFGATGTVFKGSTSPALTFDSRFVCNGNINIPSGATAYDFAASMFNNDADFELILGEYTGGGTVVAVKSPVIDHTSTKSRFRDNNGLANTYVGGRWYIDTGDSVATTISSIGVYVKAAGTTTEEDLQWVSSAGNNDLTFDSEQAVEIQIAGSINVSAVSGGSDKNITLTLRHWDDSASAYVDLPNLARGVSTSASTFHNIGIIGYATVNEGDRIELWVQNDSDTVNITIDEGSLLSISERAN